MITDLSEKIYFGAVSDYFIALPLLYNFIKFFHKTYSYSEMLKEYVFLLIFDLS